MSSPSTAANTVPARAGRLLLSLLLLIATPLAAQPAGPSGIAFWSQPSDGLWFDGLRWGGVLPWQVGTPDSLATASLPGATAYTISLLGQGQGGQCHHLSLGNPLAALRIAGSSTRAELAVHGSQIDNQGTILIGGDDALHDSLFIIATHTNANGSGRIRLAKPAVHDARIAAANNLGWLLVNWPSHTIAGHGSIGVRLQNDGLIEADVAGKALRFDGAHTLTNNGSLRARGGGQLVLEPPNGPHLIEQGDNGLIQIDAGSAASLAGCGSGGLRGGRLSGPGMLTITCQGAPMEGVHLTANALVGFFGNSGLYIGPDGLRNDGLINTGPNGFVASRFGSSATITGSGRLQLEGGLLAALFGGAGFALVNEAGHRIGGQGVIALALTNRGELLADRNGQSAGPAELRLQTSAMRNEALMVARNGGSLRVAQITLAQGTTGRLGAAAASSVVLEAATISGGELFTTGDGVIVADGSASRLESLAIAAGTRLVVPCSREMDLAGTLLNDGRIEVDNAGCGPNFATLRGNGAVRIDGSGELRLRADSGLSDAATLSAGSAPLELGVSQRLTGHGRLAGALRVEGAIAPDQPFAPAGIAGTLTLTAGSSLQLTASSDLHIDIATPGSFDRIAGSGSVVLDGSLVLGFAPGFATAGEAAFDIVSGSAVSGAFDAVLLPPGKRCGTARVEVLADRARLFLDVPPFCDSFEAA
jgi:hypothetical protein